MASTPSQTFTLDELVAAMNRFTNEECEVEEGMLRHKKCGGAIRVGFLNLFYLNDDGSLDPGYDGFGIGPKRAPYCEECFPPDGFNFTFARRVPILKERPKPYEKVSPSYPKLLME